MAIKELIKKYRNIITIFLALIGIGIMAYYDYCDTACSYLQGDILGIDLKWIGIAYMGLILIFAAFKQFDFVRALLAAGLGVEIFLFSFQIRNNVLCPYCLAFAVTVIAAFIVNYDASPSWLQNPRKMWLYFLGEVNFPIFKIKRLPLVVVALIGYFFVFLTFTGSALPAYAQDKNAVIPSLGKGSYEVLILADYFCPPCRRIDTKTEPLLKELLNTGKIKLTFVDVPFSRPAPTFAKYYLYAVNASDRADNIFHIRRVLFDAAQDKRVKNENELLEYLKEKNINLKKMDEKSVFPLLTAIIKEHKVNATPTCVIKYSATDTKKYVGDDKIWEGLIELKKHLQNSN
jgi:thiol:disulfide interchange protein DsbA